MRLDLNGQQCHLSYCTNIHAAESWEEVRDGLRKHVPDIRASVCPEQSFGLGLRLAAAAAESLQSPAAMEELKAVLADTGSYIFTINGFPYGNFHGQPVKEGAYKPDWTDQRRLDYTNQLATLLDDLLPADCRGSISTVPGTFKPWANENRSAVQVIANNLVRHVAHLIELKRTSGKHIALALEPEPYCLLETIEETVAYYKDYLFADTARQLLAELTGMSDAECESALHEHIGVCYDVCHAAVEFENASDSVNALIANGIEITKLQLSSALRIVNMSAQQAENLRPFAEPVYLHQVVQRSTDGTLTRFKDMDEALAASEAANGSEWRIHFHVPVFLDRLKHFDTTQNFLREILTLQQSRNLSDHLEVETYTWDVLPDEYRSVQVSAAIARELNWVKDQLGVIT